MPGGRGGGGAWTRVSAPIPCLFTWIFFSVLHFLHQSTHKHTHSHTLSLWHALYSSDCLDIPCDHLGSPFLLYFPSPSPFNIKPLTLCGKWAHSPIQCLLRHDGSEFYIKRDKAVLGCKTRESARSNARCRTDVGKERVWRQHRDNVCESWAELKSTEDAVAKRVWGGGRSAAGSWALRACRGNKGSGCHDRRSEPSDSYCSQLWAVL